MKTLLILAVVCCTILDACKETTQTQPPPTTTSVEYIPLAVGNWWRYTNYNSPDTNAYWEWKITETKILNNKMYYALTTSSYNMGAGMSKSSDTSYFRYESGDLMRYAGVNLPDYIIFDAPFTIAMTDSSSWAIGTVLLGDTDSLEVPAGKFYNCLRFITNESYHDTEPTYDIVAPCIGYLRMSGFKWKLELKSYNIVSN